MLLYEETQFLFLSLPFVSHVQVFLSEISLVFHLKCPQSSFISHSYVFDYFCSVDTRFLYCFLSRYSVVLCIFMSSSSLCMDASTLSSMLTSIFAPSFLSASSISTSSLGCKALCIVMNFLFICSICFPSSSTSKIVPSI